MRSVPHPSGPFSVAASAAISILVAAGANAQAPFAGTLRDSREVHLADVRQLTFGGENAEAYWSFDGRELIYQARGGAYACDQIFRLDPEVPGERSLVSTGTGRTTCAYFLPGDREVIYATTHFADPACPPVPDRSQGYVWPLYSSYEIVRAHADGSGIQRLSNNHAYDAEATLCAKDGSIIFTSTRDGDIDLYRMDADGGHVQRLTDLPGYDGGAFFNRDCSKIVWRASRPVGEGLADFRRLLAKDLVRPSKLELFVADADGGNAQQVTYLGAASFAPFFHPGGERIIFSSNYLSDNGREFDLFSIRVDGSGLERITYAPGFDGFPMFSPDGRFLAFASNRNQGQPGETDVYVARWVETPAGISGGPAPLASAADRFRADVAWLADDAREGRGLATAGIDAAATYIADRFAALALAPGGDGEGASRGFLQDFEVVVEVARGAQTAFAIDGQAVSGDHFVPMGFSATGMAEGEVVAVGYGISAPELDHDDYAQRDVAGKIVVARRFVPSGEAFADESVKRRYGDLRLKAFTAREKGAVALVVVDLPPLGRGQKGDSSNTELPEDAPLPVLAADSAGHAGLPVVVVDRALGASLFASGHRARLRVELEEQVRAAHNVVARLPAGAPPAGGPIVIGAHYDHLGFGGPGSLAPNQHAPHNGADDNASGTAALLAIARELREHQGELRRDVWLVAFSGEEAGLLGSTHFTKQPPAGLVLGEVLAMVNLDMVGRLREKLSVLGAGSAEEWSDLVPPACAALGITCVLGGDGYGPSDQTPFYAAGIPVIYLFTGTHAQYHRPTDDTELINASGGARVAALAADVALRLARRTTPLTYVRATAPAPRGDSRSYGASLGTIPDYADEGAGVLLAGVRPGSAAEQAGMLRGDRLVGLAGKEIGDIYDFMYILRASKPGETVPAVVERGGERLELEVTFGTSRRRR